MSMVFIEHENSETFPPTCSRAAGRGCYSQGSAHYNFPWIESVDQTKKIRSVDLSKKSNRMGFIKSPEK